MRYRIDYRSAEHPEKGWNAGRVFMDTKEEADEQLAYLSRYTKTWEYQIVDCTSEVASHTDLAGEQGDDGRVGAGSREVARFRITT